MSNQKAPSALTAKVIITGIAAKADGSLGLRVTTTADNISPDEKAAFFDLMNRECTILVQPDGEAAAGLKEIKGEFDKKSPSQRLRSTMYVLWKHMTDSNMIEISFETFYLRRMESFIEALKQQLPEK
jgi:hypothetical protein